MSLNLNFKANLTLIKELKIKNNMKLLFIITVSLLMLSISYSYSKPLIGKDNYNLKTQINLKSKDEFKTLHGKDFDSMYKSKSVRIEQDTSSIKNEITKVYSRDNLKFFIEIKLIEDLIPIKIQIYNMLGNLVKDVHNGTVVGKVSEFNFDASNLPNGFYLCILQGPNFRDAEKFTISR